MDESKSEEKNVETFERTIKQEVCVKSCPVDCITVFIDQAEVNRVIEVDVNVGEVEVLITDLPSVIDKDSISVKCFGNGTIIEVAYQEKHLVTKVNEEEENKTASAAEKIRHDIEELKNEKKKCEDKIVIAEKERKLLENFVNCVSCDKTDKVAEIVAPENVKNFVSLLDAHRQKSEDLSESIFNLEVTVKSKSQAISVLKENLSKVNPGAKDIKTARNVSVLLDVEKDGKLNLVLSYVVSNASWTPLYDVRAFNKDSSVQIRYFATISQSTGEDWNDAKLSLSTALPSVGGSPPKLQLEYLQIQKLKPIKTGFGTSVSRSMAPRRDILSNYDPTIPRSQDCYYGSVSQESPQLIALAKEGLTSTSFEISRRSTIQSDGVGHKVSICQLDFSPQFEYITIPKAASHAFLKIRATNESNYAMLAGDANVFLDNNFLTKSTLPAVSPSEEFEMALGVDPAVKVTYKPLKKYQQTTGLISKNTVCSYHQQIEIKNTKAVPIKIKVTDQCPKSLNDKIKVTLQDPDIKFPKSSSANEPTIISNGIASLHTMDNKIDWNCEIAPSKTQTLNLKYQVENPVGVLLDRLSHP